MQLAKKQKWEVNEQQTGHAGTCDLVVQAGLLPLYSSPVFVNLARV